MNRFTFYFIHDYFIDASIPIFGTSYLWFINLKQLKLQLSEDTGAASGSAGEVSPVHVQNIVTQPVTCNIRSKVMEQSIVCISPGCALGLSALIHVLL